MKIPKKDMNGRKLTTGDVVRITGIPDISDWTRDQKDFSLAVFEHLVGKYKRIADFNDLDMAELNFRMKEKGEWEHHTVWIEPYLLKLKRKRK